MSSLTTPELNLESSEEAPRSPELDNRNVSRLEIVRASLVLAAVLVLAFPDVVFRGKSLTPSDYYNPFDERFTDANYGPNFVHAQEWSKRGLIPPANMHDPEASWWQGEPAAEFLRSAIVTREMPFWDPYVGGGAPAMANLLGAFFFPPNLIVAALGNGSSIQNIYALALLWVGGLGTHLFIRRHSLSASGSMLGAVAFMLSGAMVQFAGSFLHQPIACLPLVLLATRHFIELPTLKRAACMALVYAVTALASFPPILVGVFCLAVYYFALSFLFYAERKQRTALLLRYTIGVLLSLGLVAFYYLPAVLTLRHTSQLGRLYQTAALEFVSPVAFFQLLSPTIMGGVATYAFQVVKVAMVPHLFFVGVGPLVLGLLAVGKRKGGILGMFALSATLLLLLELFGVPPVHWLGYLPGLRTIHIARYFPVLLPFLIAVLAAVGFDSLSSGKTTRVSLLGPTLCMSAVLGGLYLAAARSGNLDHAAAWRWLADFRLLVIYVSLLLTVTFFLTRRPLPGVARRMLLLLALGLVIVEAVANSWFPRQNRRGLIRRLPAYAVAAQMNASNGRAFTAAALNANLNSPLNIFSLDSLYAFNSPRMFALYRRYVTPKPEQFLREAETLPSEQLLDRANIKLLVIRSAKINLMAEILKRGYPSVFNDGYTRIFKRPTSPRYFFTSWYRVVSSPEAALRLVTTAPPRELILEEQPSIPSLSNESRDSDPSVISFRRNSYKLRVTTRRPGFVYASESHFPGWTALVNGKPARIFVANYAFRAIQVPAGDSEIELSYRPPGLIIGSLISLFTFALIFVPLPKGLLYRDNS